jgi:hypothetical protein
MEKPTTKNCPYCGEEILAVAAKCKHCKQWLSERPKLTPVSQVHHPVVPPVAERPSNKTNPMVLYGLLAIVVLIILGAVAFFSVNWGTPGATSDKKCVDKGIEYGRKYSDDGKQLETLNVVKTLDMTAPGSITIDPMSGNKNDTTVVRIRFSKGTKASIQINPTINEPIGRYFLTAPSGYMYNPISSHPTLYERTFECDGSYYLYAFNITSPKTIMVQLR